MIQETLDKIEARLQSANSLSADKRAELLQLVATLKAEMERLERTHADQAQSIARFTELSAHEATRAEPKPELLRLSLTGLASSVRGFEQSHPRLVQIVNTICTTLSNSGV
jgi:hypothetical protein